MEILRDIAAVVEIVFFGALAGVAARHRLRRGSSASLWFALTTGILALVVVGGLLIGPDDGDRSLWGVKLVVIVLSLFPYSQYRFMEAFARPSRLVDRAVLAMTVVLIAYTLLLPSFPGPDDARPGWFVAYLVLFLAHWTGVSLIVAFRLWRAGHGQPTLARRRMRLLSLASLTLTLALLLTGTVRGDSGPAAVAIQLAAMATAVLLYLGYSPPRALRTLWSWPETDAVRRSVPNLMAAQTEQEVAQAILPGLAGVVGSRGAGLVDREGRLIGAVGLREEEVLRAVGRRDETSGGADDDGDPLLTFEYPFGVVALAANPQAPFFGREEIGLVNAVATLTGIALGRVAETTHARETQERLERLNELKNEFVAVVAHDLRSPMTVIAGYADLLVAGGDRMPSAQRAEMLGTISRSVKKLSRLVEDVLQVARIESGEYAYEVAPFDVATVVRGAIRDVGGGHDPSRFDVITPPELPLGLGDADRHWQVLTNLLSNALKFSAPGSPVRVRVDDGPMLQVAVEDEGSGIAPEDLDKLFEKFSRPSRTNGSNVHGHGLGLYICKSMIEAQGGTIAVRSTPGRGTTFSYTIPKAEVRA